MIREKSGDLLASDAEVMVNAVNTVGVMGKGQTSPDMFREYAKAARAGDLQIGRKLVCQTGATGPRLVINFPTKRHWHPASRFIERTTYGSTVGVASRCAQVSTYRELNLFLGCPHGESPKHRRIPRSIRSCRRR